MTLTVTTFYEKSVRFYEKAYNSNLNIYFFYEKSCKIMLKKYNFYEKNCDFLIKTHNFFLCTKAKS